VVPVLTIDSTIFLWQGNLDYSAADYNTLYLRENKYCIVVLAILYSIPLGN
jgi:hypothetical protein